jgi:NADH-quinone oxidoreductase subunit N
LQDVFRFPIPSIDWLSILPTIIVTLTGVLALVFEMLNPKRNNNAIVIVCLLGLSAAAVPLVMGLRWPDEITLAGMFVRDRFGLVLQLLLVLSAALSILFSEGYLREKRIAFGEFYPLVCWSTVGAMVMVSTQNLLIARSRR